MTSSTHSSYLLENSNPNNYSIITVTRFQKFTPPTGLTGLHAYLAGQSTAGTTSGYPLTQLVSGSSIIDGPHSSSPTENKRIKNILIFFKSSMIFIPGIENLLIIQKLFLRLIKSFDIIGTVYFIISKLQDCKTFQEI